MNIKVTHRGPQYFGRFGGGWQWKVGFQASTGFRTVIVSLLVFEIRFTFGKRGSAS